MNEKPTPEEIVERLTSEGIAFERHDHPPVATCEEARAVLPGLRGRGTKNLFLRDEKGKRHVLLVVGDEKEVDLKRLSKELDMRPLSLASPERLKEHLGLEPGAVTILGLSADREHRVELVIDEDLAGCDGLHCHPLVNTATLVISWEGVMRFLDLTGHKPRYVPIPRRATRHE